MDSENDSASPSEERSSLDSLVDLGNDLPQNLDVSPQYALLLQNRCEGSQVNFDEILPASHVYLGHDLEEISGRHVYSDLATVNLPILPGNYGTVLPGHTFPLNARDPSRTSLLRSCMEGNHTFGCLSIKFSSFDNTVFGTTAEIYEFSDERGTVKIKAKVRQRFKLLGSKPTSSGYRMGKVIILPEIKLVHPFCALQVASLNSIRISNKNKCRKIESFMFPWPKWVYDMYDPEILSKRCNNIDFLKQGLRKDKQLNVMPKDPTELSFWIGNQMDSEKRLIMLALNSPIPRLRWLLNYFNRCYHFSCVNCNVVVAKPSDCFAMSVEGAQSTYVNPEGYHHDTLTTLSAENIITVSSPSSHFSWFPGYAWSIAVCLNCQNHLGWEFTAINTNLHPSRFWGLARQSMKTRFTINSNPQELDIM